MTLVRAMTGRDFAAEARTLERMGLAGQSASAISRIAQQGFA